MLALPLTAARWSAATATARGHRGGRPRVADVDLDLFYGIVVHTHPLPGRHLYADRGQIWALTVLLAADVDDLHEPSEPFLRARTTTRAASRSRSSPG